jgi:putative transposase
MYGLDWNAVDVTGVCNPSTAPPALSGVGADGSFQESWRERIMNYDARIGLDWSCSPAGGPMTKAPLGGPKTGPESA